MRFTRMTQVYAAGEKVLVRGRFLAEPAVVVSAEGERVTVAVAPDSNRTTDISAYADWDRRTVDARVLRRYEW